jgi:hypothetical protein
VPSIAGGMDIHRKQVTFDYLDVVTGEVKCEQITPADRGHSRAWLQRFAGVPGVAFAVEACTPAADTAAAFTWPPLSARADWAPCPRQPAAAPDRGAHRPVRAAHPGLAAIRGQRRRVRHDLLLIKETSETA